MRFPHEVRGWLTENEGNQLAKLAEDKLVLEIGAYCGRSTLCLAQTARFVVSVDHHRGDAGTGPADTLDEYRLNLRRYHADKKVLAIVGNTKHVLPTLPLKNFDMVFIDGSHELEDVMSDMRNSRQIVTDDAIFALHDWPDYGVCLAAQEILQWQKWPNLVDRLAWGKVKLK